MKKLIIILFSLTCILGCDISLPKEITTGLSSQCKATTKKGTQCKNECVSGSQYCKVHRSSKNRKTSTKCKAKTQKGKRCTRAAIKGGYCKQHYKSK